MSLVQSNMECMCGYAAFTLEQVVMASTHGISESSAQQL